MQKPNFEMTLCSNGMNAVESKYRIDVWFENRVVFDIVFNKIFKRFVVDATISKYGNEGKIRGDIVEPFKNEFQEFVDIYDPMFLDSEETIAGYMSEMSTRKRALMED